MRGPTEHHHSDLETDNDTSSSGTWAQETLSRGQADLTEIARSFQPQTELLNPCAKINEFILNTHPHVNVAITHSDEWSSSALSQMSVLVQTLWNKVHSGQGDDSDVLLRVLSDYKVIVRNGVAMLEAR
ncbi:hypothetical protein ARMGADRAFT_525855 [Armillaria gallica]|uniref:Uncharacterized protein n=1 Tax=Armillaria gallica TaxID=47427 RepID=A0A2H3EII8_ARMGA|nr:hypothetical protein ARMGADRAFT_525855 [Armillaria gallica]